MQSRFISEIKAEGNLHMSYFVWQISYTMIGTHAAMVKLQKYAKLEKTSRTN